MTRIGVQIISNRKDYLPVLLSSLLRQTFQEWDIILVAPESVIKSHLVSNILERMLFEGHRVKGIIEESTNVKGIGALRNLALQNDPNEIGVRVDDDSWCEPDYLARLLSVLELEKKDAGIVGGIVPLMRFEKIYREVPNKFMRATNNGVIFDESIYFFNTEPGAYYVADHLRSSYMYFNERLKSVGGFPTEMDAYAGFREETVPCLRLQKKGFRNFIVPSAICWHFQSPTGGTRPQWEKIGIEGQLEAEDIFRGLIQ